MASVWDEFFIGYKKKKKDFKEKWAFAPFYGRGAGFPSQATNPPGQEILTNQPAAPSTAPAMPGAGGINSGSVPGGANSGMGPA